MHDSDTKDPDGAAGGRLPSVTWRVAVRLVLDEEAKLEFDCAPPTGVQDALPNSVFNTRDHLHMALGQ